LGPSPCGSGVIWGYPLFHWFRVKKKRANVFFKKTNFLFLKQLFYNDSLDENFFGETTWWFIDPLEEFAGTLGTFEVETAWVLLRV